MHQPDALIIGGGPAGSVTALLLAKAGWKVVLVERKAFPRRKVCGEYLSVTNWPLLAELGLAERFDQLAGPNVEAVGLLVGRWLLHSRLPRPSGLQTVWGRALSREHLDAMLLSAAADAGAEVLQPAECTQLQPAGERFACRIRVGTGSGMHEREIDAGVVVAAHGSWELNTLPTQPAESPAHAGDLFGFKAHFEHSELAPGLMPLLSFPGGYGGLVHCEHDRVSLSCCVRRDVMGGLHRSSGRSAGDALFNHIMESTPAARQLLDSAHRSAPWLAAGPIRPGIRSCYQQGIFLVGNAAGESHPAVAEGISMAMQSGWLLARELIAAGLRVATPAIRDQVGRRYTRQWRSCFAGRIRASELVARWAMQPRYVEATLPLIRSWPSLLTLGARLAGKSKQVVC